MTTTIFKEKKLSQDKEIKRKIGVILSKIYREVTIKGRPVKDVRINLLINEMRQEEAVDGRLGKGLTHVGEALWFGIYDGHRLHTGEDVAKVFDALYDYNKACMVRQSDKKKAMEKQTTIEAYPLTLDEYQEGAPFGASTIPTNQNIQTNKIMYKNQKCIIRTNRAGVFFANVKEYDKVTRDIILTDCRRLWYWDGACSLSQLAIDGTRRPSDCKFSIKVPEMAVMEVIEIIPCSNKAIESIEGVREWKR